MTYLFSCHPWDLEDEGIDAALARLRGEIGVDALTLTAASGEVVSFRPRPELRPRTTHVPAGLHFQPNPALYGGARIRPIVSNWMKTRNPIHKIAESAARHGLALRLSVSACRGRAWSERYPIAAAVNLFDEPIPDRLCPTHPDVHACRASIIDDLCKNYHPAAIELDADDFLDAPTARDDSHGDTVLGPIERQLLTWCFCPGCRDQASAAGLDPQVALDQARLCVDRCASLDRPPSASLAVLLREHPDLARFVAIRRERVAAIITALRRRSAVPLVLSLNAAGPVDAWGSVAPLCTEFETISAVTASSPIASWPSLSAPWIARMGGAPRVEVRLPCTPPSAPDGPSLVSAVHQASQSGHPVVGFSAYGAAPAESLDWVRQAVRYARREGA